jgi:hypothetical protein
MFYKKLNGYDINIFPLARQNDTSFVTLIDEMQKSYHFTIVKSDGKWQIRNPLTVPPFIRAIEPELIKEL